MPMRCTLSGHDSSRIGSDTELSREPKCSTARQFEIIVFRSHSVTAVVIRPTMKRYYGTISPTKAASTFTRESWLAYIATATDLSRPEPQIGRNPFTGDSVTFQPPADTVHFAPNGEHIASFGWSQNDEAMITVAFDDPHADTAVERARKIADAMEAEFSYEEFSG